MNSYQNLSMDEIIFENRNKNYGAFQLRQTIDKNATVGLFVTISAFIVFMLIVKNSNTKNREPIIDEHVVTIETQNIKNVIPDIPKPKPPKSITQPPKVNTTMFKDFKVVQNVVQPSAVPLQQDLPNKPIADKIITDGIDAPVKPVEPTIITASLSGPPSSAPTPVPAITTILPTSQILPSFPNGREALMEFLKNNIHPYSTDIETGKIGKVIIRFYVDVDGTVRNPEVIKDGIGGRCGEAAISAIKKMPKWKPGLQNGTPVKVYFTLPVAFDFSHN